MSTKPSVLVAEDEGALITLLRYNLEREGYRVLEAQDLHQRGGYPDAATGGVVWCGWE